MNQNALYISLSCTLSQLATDTQTFESYRYSETFQLQSEVVTHKNHMKKMTVEPVKSNGATNIQIRIHSLFFSVYYSP